MPDISMCCNTKCPSRELCYRYRAKPNEYRQSFMDYKPSGEKCESFYPIGGWDDRYLKPEGTIVNNLFEMNGE